MDFLRTTGMILIEDGSGCNVALRMDGGKYRRGGVRIRCCKYRYALPVDDIHTELCDATLACLNHLRSRLLVILLKKVKEFNL